MGLRITSRLTEVVCSSAGSGHYTAFAISDEQWFHFNDQSVRASEAAHVAACKPYILFYIRRELALPAS